MHTTSATLLERIKTHDGLAWPRFVDLYTPLLLMWARRQGLQDSDAADLVQDVFALLLKKLPEFTYDRNRSFRAWLRTVMLNQWRTSNRRLQLLRVGVEPDHLPAPQDEEFWEQEYRQHLVSKALQLMQSQFDQTTWKACWECIVNDRSATEVAAEFGLTAGAVRAGKFRVLTRLRAELAGLLD